jgi:hypothetical protein
VGAALDEKLYRIGHLVLPLRRRCNGQHRRGGRRRAGHIVGPGGAIMQLLRQAGYGGQVVPVNPRGGTIFGYESVTSIAAIDPPVDLAVIVIRPDAILDAAWPTRGRTGSPSPSRRPWTTPPMPTTW